MAKQEERSSSSSNIPREIIEIILSKLPAKSLLRFKTVSKSWNTVISNPVFVETHLRNSPNNLLVSRYRNTTAGGFSFVTWEGRKLRTQAVLDSPNRYNKILCECNGVLLLTKNYPSNYLLWNPSTRRERYLVCPYDQQIYPWIPGICYDPITDDFKVVSIGRNYYAIYSSKNNSWKIKGGFCKNVTGDRGTFFDGSIYWVLWFNTTPALVYFDPKTEELKMLHKPEQLSYLHNSCSLRLRDSLCFLCLRGSLCLSGKIRDDNDGIKYLIWIMEKGIVGENPNWKEFITFENVTTRIEIDVLKPICFVENKILVYSGEWRYEDNFPSERRYAYYSPSEKRFEEFEEKYFDKFVQYRNSLYAWD